MPSDRVRTILPGDTATTSDVIAPIVPDQAYLGGGTAIAMHLGHRVSRHLETDGLRIAGLSDLSAMKLKVVGDCGERRDYFDLMTIEQRTGRTADEGLALFVARFQPEYPQQAINHILR